MRRPLAVGLLLLAAAGLITYVAWPRGGQAQDLAHQIQNAQVQTADFYIVLPLEGILESTRSAPIVNLAQETQIVWTLTDGVWVEEGEVVVKLNPAELEKRVNELEAEVAEAEEKVRQTEADAEKQLQNARSNLAKAEDALELARGQNQAAIEKAEAEKAFLEKELAVAQGQLDKRKRLLEERLVPITEVEAAEDEVRAKQFGLDKAQRALERALSEAETAAQLHGLDIEKAKLELEEAEANRTRSVIKEQRELAAKRRDLEEAQEQLDGTQLKAPVSGMLLLDQTWEDGWRSLRVGDRVWEGQRIANVVDPNEMRVRCNISEADIDRVKVGRPASVRVPALGGRVLQGKVEAVDNLARQRSPWEGGVPGKTVFGALIQITDREPKLRPGMGGNIEIALDHVKDGLAVPLEALFPAKDGHVVYRVEGNVYREVLVRVGERSYRMAKVEGKLHAGDLVACQRPPAGLVVGATSGEEK